MPLPVITPLPESGVLTVTLEAEPAGVQLVLMVHAVAGHCTGKMGVVRDLMTSNCPMPIVTAYSYMCWSRLLD